MRSSKSRSRNKSRNQRSLGNVVNRVFDSSGPEGKVRGTPQQIIEKYLALARDAQLSNDRVAEQSFLQHAEHYTRMLGEAQREQAERQAQFGGPQGNGEDDRAYNGNDRADGRDDNRRDDNRRDDNRRDDNRRDDDRRDNSRDNNRRDDDRRDNNRSESRNDNRSENRSENRNDRREDRRERPAREPQPDSHESLPEFLRAPMTGIPEPVSMDDAGPVDTPEARTPEVAVEPSPAPSVAVEAEPQAEAEAPRPRRRAAAATPRKPAKPKREAAAKSVAAEPDPTASDE